VEGLKKKTRVGEREGEKYRRSANIAQFAAFNNIIQSTHDLLHWRITIQAMDLQNVNIRPQPLYTLVYGIENMLPAQPTPIYSLTIINSEAEVEGPAFFADFVEALGHDDNLGTRDRVFLHELAQDLFGYPIGISIGHIPCVDPQVISPLDNREGSGSGQDPRLPGR
jgi:hypothetical protein